MCLVRGFGSATEYVLRRKRYDRSKSLVHPGAQKGRTIIRDEILVTQTSDLNRGSIFALYGH